MQLLSSLQMLSPCWSNGSAAKEVLPFSSEKKQVTENFLQIIRNGSNLHLKFVKENNNV